MSSSRQTKSTNGGVSNSSQNKISLANGFQTTVQLPPIDMSIEEQRALGYMPLRDDFEREFKNQAEAMLSTLSISNNQVAFMDKEHSSSHGEPNEELVDYELKLTLIKMYREVLNDRHKMKKIAREYGLINNASALINNYNNSLSIQNGQAAPNTGFKKKRGAQNSSASRKDPRYVIVGEIFFIFSYWIDGFLK